jgi:hypothetical protein
MIKLSKYKFTLHVSFTCKFFIRLLLLCLLICGLFVWSFFHSQSYEQSFDLALIITQPIHNALSLNIIRIRFATGFIFIQFYIIVLLACCIFVHNRIGLFPRALVAWFIALIINLFVNIPKHPDLIEYWTHSLFPLERLVGDNTVCWHLLVAAISIDTVLSIINNYLIKLYFLTYLTSLLLFIIGTRNTSTYAILAALFIVLASRNAEQRILDLYHYVRQLYNKYRFPIESIQLTNNNNGTRETELDDDNDG